MGLFGGGNSASTSETITTVDNTSLAAQDSGIVNRQGSISISNIDAGAIGKSFDFAKNAFTELIGGFNNIVTSQQKQYDSTLGLARSSLEENSQVVGTAIAGSSYQTASGAKSSLNTVVWVAGIAAAITILPRLLVRK